MWAQLFLLSCMAVSGFLVYRVIDSGLGGPLSLWWFRRRGKANQQAVVTSNPVELKLQMPILQFKKAFQDIVSAPPRDPSTGEPVSSGPKYNEWVTQCRNALLERAIEGVLVFRTVDNLYRETYCKFSQQQASQRAWQDAQNAHQSADKELRDICEWAGTLLQGWDHGILQQASQIIQQKQNEEAAKFKQHAQSAHAQQANSSRSASEIEAERVKEAQRAKKAEEAQLKEEARVRQAKEALAKKAEEELLREEEASVAAAAAAAASKPKQASKKKGGA